MNKVFLILSLVFSPLISQTFSKASSVTCIQALKLDLNTFSKSYRLGFATPTDKNTTLPDRRAIAFWGDCKYKDTFSKLTNYPRIKATALKLRQAQLAILNAVLSERFARQEVGSMYLDYLSLAAAETEMHIAQVISLLKTSAGAKSSKKIVADQRRYQSKIRNSFSDMQEINVHATGNSENIEIIKKSLAIIDQICGPNQNSVNLLIYARTYEFFNYTN